MKACHEFITRIQTLMQFAPWFERAALWIESCEGLLIGAGAGMGVDSGLPDFRGDDGFWKAYPAFIKRKLGFREIANPHWFQTHPRQAWGFYGHRLNLYRRTQTARRLCITEELESIPPAGRIRLYQQRRRPISTGWI